MAVIIGITSTMKRRDGQPWQAAHFIADITRARLDPQNEKEEQLTERERIIRQAQNLERIASTTGMEVSSISAEEWQEIQRKELERIAAIPKS